MKKYIGVDILKFIMAIFVVAIHTYPNPFKDGIHNDNNILDIDQIWDIIVRFAVPYFFIASGFFLFLKLKKESDNLLRQKIVLSFGKRIMRLYIYWTIIFLPITIWSFINNRDLFFVDLFSFLKNVFIVGHNFLSWPLWYLLTMIYSIVILYFFIKKNINVKIIFVFSILLFLISILLEGFVKYKTSNTLLLTLYKIKQTVSFEGRLFTGMLYLMIGALFANINSKISKEKLFVITITGVLIQISNLSFISIYHSVFLPAVIFYLSVNWKVASIRSGYFFRKCSTVLYFTHMIVFFIYGKFIKECLCQGYDSFLVSIIIPIILTPIIIKYENKLVFLKKIF